jgi:hypothetical protein
VLILVAISTRRNCLLVEEQPGDVKQNNDDVRGAVRFKNGGSGVLEWGASCRDVGLGGDYYSSLAW